MYPCIYVSTHTQGHAASLYIRRRDDEFCYSSRAKKTKKASPPPSQRTEVLKFLKARAGGGKTLGHYDAARSTVYGTPTVDIHDQIYHSGPRKAWTMVVEHKDSVINHSIRF